MEKSNRNFLEIPSYHLDLEDDIKDISSLDLNSLDESFYSEQRDKYSGKNNDVLKSFDLLCDSASKASDQSLEEINIPRKPKHHKSLESIIKFLKNSMKNKATIEQHQNIFRKPTEYEFRRGISGLQIKVIKETSTSSERFQNIVKR
jgi:hypothetical protein